MTITLDRKSRSRSTGTRSRPALRLGAGRRDLRLGPPAAHGSGAARAALRAGHPQQREALGGAGQASRAARRFTPGRSSAGPSLATPLGGGRQQRRSALRLGPPAPDPAAAAALGALAAGPAQLQGSDGSRLLRRF